jgi:cytidine deaminase
MTNDELIARAEAVVNHRRLGDAEYGQVGAALLTAAGAVHAGVCIDTPSGMGFCAEHAAIAAMITAGESRIERIVAVWKDDARATTILPPCGRCREFMRQVDPANLETDVILSRANVVKLKDLLPYHEWPS